MNGLRAMTPFGCFVLAVVCLALSSVAAMSAGLSKPQGTLVMNDFGYTEYHSGAERWTVTAKKSRHDFDKNVAQIDNLLMQLFSSVAPTQISLRADSGVLSFAERAVELRGAVEVNDPRGYHFMTDQLSYDDHTQIARGQGSIAIEIDGLQVSGRGFDYVTSTGIFRIHQGVEALIDAPRK